MIPVYVTAFNSLTFTRGLVDWLLRCEGARPIVVDNASTYPPLLEWYERCPVEVIRRPENGGPRAAWQHVDLSAGPFYAVTDCDLDLSACPLDLLQRCVAGLEKYPAYCKAGPSLEVDDLPERSPLTKEVREVEGRYWVKQLDADWWDALIDTTFAVYRGGESPCTYGPALRAERPYTARHLPWYTIPGAESAEEAYYLRHLEFQSGLYWSVRQKEIIHAAASDVPLPDVQAPEAAG